ncbi:MAG: hypothetical protein HQK83_03895 [Fibrobacteria bacterium]|nr:hypothetical protein [Fibrobacteria bacterium]
MITFFNSRTKIFLGLFAVLLFSGCAELQDKLDKFVKSPIDTTSLTEKTDILAGKAEELLDQNEGKAVVTGVLLKEGGVTGLSKRAYINAAGLAKVSSNEPVPLANADIMFYDALSASTNSSYHTQSDADGKYYAVLDEGLYFAFAVKFDPTTQELITARIDNIGAKKDSIVDIQNTTAAEDKISPTIVSIYNATSPDQNSGIYLLTGVTNTNPIINIVFSEPMLRSSATEIYMGLLDTSAENGAFALSDTMANIEQVWNGNNTVLMLTLKTTIDTTRQYGILINKTLKDMAKNSLEAKAKATFVPVNAANLEDFVVAETYPANGSEIKPLQAPGIIFTRPVEIFSVLNNVIMTPKIPGLWEIRGNKAVFTHKQPFEIGKEYTVSIPITVKDISGATLKEAKELKFKVAAYSGAAGAGGEEGVVAQIVEGILDAFLQGDIPKFASHLHPNFRMYMDGKLESKEQVVESIQRDVSERDQMMMGISAPVFDIDSSACVEGNIIRWLVHPAGNPDGPKLWVETNVPPGATRRVWDKNRTLISNETITWDPSRPKLTYDGKNYFYDADFSNFHGPVSADNAEDDETFWADLLKRTSNVVLQPVKSDMQDEFFVDEGVIVKGDTAKVAAKQKKIEKPNRFNFEPRYVCNPDEAKAHTELSLLNFVLVKENNVWSIVFLNGAELGSMDEKVEYDSAFKSFENFENIKPIELLSPVDKADNTAADDGSITLKIKNLRKLDNIKYGSKFGYLIGLAEDPWFLSNRPRFGALYFVKADTTLSEVELKITNDGKPVQGGNGTSILRDMHSLGLPGWERAMFEYPIEELVNWEKGIAGVYFWKAIAVTDTSASMFLASGFTGENFLGESDFYKSPEYGQFAVKNVPDEKQIELIFFNQAPMDGQGGMFQGGFDDRDLDQVPDHMEIKYGTDPNNRSSYPDFTVDSDLDGMADFLEEMLDKDGSDSLIYKAADSAGIEAQLKRLAEEFNIIIIDSDKDGFPDEIEEMKGFDPFNAMSKPGTRARQKAPTGVFKGLIAFGDSPDERFAIKVTIKNEAMLTAKYECFFKKDTLRDSVAAYFNEGIGELMFPIRFETGPEAGNSLLCRGNYDMGNGVLQGPVDMVASPKDKFSTDFGGGPYMGQWAASSKSGVNVENFLHFGPATGPGPNNPDMHVGYREPPAGVFAGWKFHFVTDKNVDPSNQMIIIVDNNGDTAYTLKAHYNEPNVGGHLMFHPNMDGFHIEADYWKESPTEHEKLHLNGELMRAPFIDSTGNQTPGWVFDGGFNAGSQECGQYEFGADGDIDSTRCMRYDYHDLPGEFSARVAEKGFNVNGDPTGTLKGWARIDEYGTGFNEGPGPVGDDRDGDCIPDWEDPAPDDHEKPIPGGQCGMMGGGAPPYVNGTNEFMKFLVTKKFIQTGDTFNLLIQGNGVMLKSINDSNHIFNSNNPECGFVRIIPIKGEDDVYMKFNQLKLDDANSFWGMQLILLEGNNPQVPGIKDQEYDQNGKVYKNVIVTEPRQIHGEMCMDNGNMGPGPAGEDRDGDCIPDNEDPAPDDYNNPNQGGKCGFAIPDALQGRADDIMDKSKTWKIFKGGKTAFHTQLRKYIGFSATENILNMGFDVITLNYQNSHTFGGRFQEMDGLMVHKAHDLPFPASTEYYAVAASNIRGDGDIAIAIGPNGPAVVLVPVPPNDEINMKLQLFGGQPWMVRDFMWELVQSEKVNMHVIDMSGTQASVSMTMVQEMQFMPQGDFIVLAQVFPENTDSLRYVVLSSPNDFGRPAVGKDSTGNLGLLLAIYKRADLDQMSGNSGGGVDLDRDCVPDDGDPDPNNPNNPVPGGKCVGPGFMDNDGDCVNDSEDPDPNDPNKPAVGGKCVQDMDGDCIEDKNDSYPNDFNMPIQGGDCGFKDFDGDCVDDRDDPNPNDRNNPTQNGQCNTVGDKDQDCVPDNMDPEPGNPNVPSQGGQCGGAVDNDGDCVPDEKDPDPNNPDNPFQGGQCGGFADEDGDCVDDSRDPDPKDRDNPTFNGECGGASDDPQIYRGVIAGIQSALIASNGIVGLTEGPGTPIKPITIGKDAQISVDPDGFTVTPEPNNGAEMLVFLATSEDETTLLVKANEPIVIRKTQIGRDPNDEDGDCVLKQDDPNDFDFNNPTQGGQCGGKDVEPVVYKGVRQTIWDELVNTRGEVIVVFGGSEEYYHENIGMAPALKKNPEGSVITVHPKKQDKILIFLAPDGNDQVPYIMDNRLLVLEKDAPVDTSNGDKDNDCVPDSVDSNPDNADIPKVGGACGTLKEGDRDNDCVPDSLDGYPDNPNMPQSGGMCGMEGETDKDKDCVPDVSDPNPYNFDQPTQGGECREEPKPIIFKGSTQAINDALTKSNGEIGIASDTSETIIWSKVVMPAELNTQPDSTVITPHPSLMDHFLIFLAPGGDDQKVLLIEDKPIVISKMKQPDEGPKKLVMDINNFHDFLTNKQLSNRDSVKILYVMAEDVETKDGIELTVDEFSFENPLTGGKEVFIKLSTGNLVDRRFNVVEDPAEPGKPMVDEGLIIVIESGYFK